MINQTEWGIRCKCIGPGVLRNLFFNGDEALKTSTKYRIPYRVNIWFTPYAIWSSLSNQHWTWVSYAPYVITHLTINSSQDEGLCLADFSTIWSWFHWLHCWQQLNHSSFLHFYFSAFTSSLDKSGTSQGTSASYINLNLMSTWTHYFMPKSSSYMSFGLERAALQSMWSPQQVENIYFFI